MKFGGYGLLSIVILFLISLAVIPINVGADQLVTSLDFTETSEIRKDDSLELGINHYVIDHDLNEQSNKTSNLFMYFFAVVLFISMGIYERFNHLKEMKNEEEKKGIA